MIFVLQTLFWIIVGIALFILLLYLIEPSLIAIPFSFILKAVLKNPPFLKVDKAFPQHRLLEENWQAIRDELVVILQNQENIPKFHEIDNIQRFISNTDDVPWRVFMFKAYDNWMESNCEQAPRTAELLRKIPEITTAMFSILGPNKHIPPHYGFYKGVYRYHLGLVIPKEGDCYLIDGGQEYRWQEGEGVLFDDTYKHEVWNKTDETRVVLFCDVYRKDLPFVFQPINKWVYGLREKSKRLKKAIANAEVPRDLIDTPEKQLF